MYLQLIFLKKKLKLIFPKKSKVPLIIHKNRSPPPLCNGYISLRGVMICVGVLLAEIIIWPKWKELWQIHNRKWSYVELHAMNKFK